MQWPHASGGSLSAHAWSILQRFVDQATRVFAADRRIIQSRWQAEAYPRENSLAFANGFYCLFETSEPHPQVMEKAWVPASDAWQADAEGCEGLAILNTVALSADTRITCGECCAAGEDGFIAVSEAATNTFVWLLVLRRTDPFVSVALEEDGVRATSSRGTTVLIPLDRPDQLSITWA